MLTAALLFFRGLSDYLKDTLSLWFSVGLLQLQRISWEQTSANIIEKVRVELEGGLGRDSDFYTF